MSSYFRDDQFVKTPLGPAVPGAQVFVCTQPATIPPALATIITSTGVTLIQPTPLATLYADPNGLIPLPQPVITDGFGHAWYYAAAGTYTVVVYWGNILQLTLPDQLIGSNGVGSISLQTNGFPNFDQAIENLIAGTSISLTTDSFGGTTLACTLTPLALEVNGTPNVSQTLLNLIAGTNISVIDNGSGGVTISSPATGTVTTTGSPISGNLVKFSGTSSITNGDLSGDVTTVGTLVTTLSEIQGVPLVITSLTMGQILEYNGTEWVNVAIPAQIALEINGTPNSSQTVLNLAQGNAITIVDGGAGLVTISSPTFGASGVSHSVGSVPDPGSSSGTTRFLREDATWQAVSSITLETNGTPNVSQVLLNLIQGTGITITDGGSGGITIASTVVGTVTNTAGSLTINQLVIGNGGADEKVLGSLGTTTTVLHGNAAGAPSFASVVENDLALTNVTTANVSTSAHGFAPILPNDVTKFLNGIGGYTVPSPAAGSISTQDIGARFEWQPLAGATAAGASAFGISPWQTGNGTSGSTAANATLGAAVPPFVLFTNASTNPSSVGMAEATGGALSLASLQSITFVIKLSQTTTTRIWMAIGHNGATLTAGYRTDTPGTSFALAGFRYSTAAGDTKWQCVTGSSSAQTTTPESTASHVDATTIHKFTLQFDGTNVNFYIDSTLVGSQNTNLPVTSTALTAAIWMDNAGSANPVAFSAYSVRGQWSQI